MENLTIAARTIKIAILLTSIYHCKSSAKIDEVYHRNILNCYDNWTMHYMPSDSMVIKCLFYREAYQERGYNPSLIIGLNGNDTIGFYTRDTLTSSQREGSEFWLYKDSTQYWSRYFTPLEKTDMHFPNRIRYIIYNNSETNDLVCAIKRIYFCKLSKAKN